MTIARWCVACAMTGIAAGFGYRHDWVWTAAASAAVLLPAALWFWYALLATRDAMTGMPVGGKHRRQGRPAELRQAPVPCEPAA